MSKNYRDELDTEALATDHIRDKGIKSSRFSSPRLLRKVLPLTESEEDKAHGVLISDCL